MSEASFDFAEEDQRRGCFGVRTDRDKFKAGCRRDVEEFRRPGIDDDVDVDVDRDCG